MISFKLQESLQRIQHNKKHFSWNKFFTTTVSRCICFAKNACGGDVVASFTTFYKFHENTNNMFVFNVPAPGRELFQCLNTDHGKFSTICVNIKWLPLARFLFPTLGMGMREGEYYICLMLFLSLCIYIFISYTLYLFLPFPDLVSILYGIKIPL